MGRLEEEIADAKQQAVTEATRQLEDMMKRLEERRIANARQQALVEAKC
jgi:hypothetical protein